MAALAFPMLLLTGLMLIAVTLVTLLGICFADHMIKSENADK
ncbi:MAG: hypothetical protein ABJE63_11910 [Lentilitoribacter sp.]